MSRVWLALISVVLCLVVAGCAGLAAGAEEGSAKQQDQQAKPKRTPAPTPTPEPTKPPLGVADLVGSDGRLTVLILGSDQRDGLAGERTDAIITASIDPSTGKVAMVSLPRDTINVPIAPGKAYAGRINALFGDFHRSSGKQKVALKKTTEALAYAFGTEIDYYVLVDFDGLVRLINSIGGIDVKLKDSLVDPSMHIGKKGLKLKKGNRHLDGKTVLAFSRSRHSDSDYQRAARQQQVIAAAADKVRNRGAKYLPSLVELAQHKVVTDLPLRAAPALLELAGGARLASPKSIVLAPGRWARIVPGTYTISPRVLEVQKMFAKVFNAVG
jgi:polyisoprenyl-teichoic acid--peptidoglycan teichoic acid transferase